MNFEFSPEDEAFRTEVREFIRANLPAEIARDTRRWLNPEVGNFRRWQRILAARGWGAPHLPAYIPGRNLPGRRAGFFLAGNPHAGAGADRIRHA
jgi:alkylation response protein AidB-like acyl-CoA dehydrogenase